MRGLELYVPLSKGFDLVRIWLRLVRTYSINASVQVKLVNSFTLTKLFQGTRGNKQLNTDLTMFFFV